MSSSLTLPRDVSPALARAPRLQNAARVYYKNKYLEAAKRAGDLQWSIFRAERQVRSPGGWACIQLICQFLTVM